MEYNVIKNANRIVASSNHVIKNPFDYRGKWHELFKNNNPIHVELGMGRGAFIIEMAKRHPNINYIGIEINESQMVSAVEKLKSLNLFL